MDRARQKEKEAALKAIVKQESADYKEGDEEDVRCAQHIQRAMFGTEEQKKACLIKEAQKHAENCKAHVDTEKGKCGGWNSTTQWQEEQIVESKTQEWISGREKVFDVNGNRMSLKGAKPTNSS